LCCLVANATFHELSWCIAWYLSGDKYHSPCRNALWLAMVSRIVERRLMKWKTYIWRGNYLMDLVWYKFSSRFKELTWKCFVRMNFLHVSHGAVELMNARTKDSRRLGEPDIWLRYSL
jgi:hypothetical protein